MGHYLSEMAGDGELTPKQRASLKRMELESERRRVLQEARVIGMTHAVKHLVRNSPLPIDLDYIQRHLGLDGRDPEAAAVREALRTAWARGSLHISEGHVVTATDRQADQ